MAAVIVILCVCVLHLTKLLNPSGKQRYRLCNTQYGQAEETGRTDEGYCQSVRGTLQGWDLDVELYMINVLSASHDENNKMDNVAPLTRGTGFFDFGSTFFARLNACFDCH